MARIDGKVTTVTDAGDLVTDIRVERLLDAPTDDRFTVDCDEHMTCCLFPAEHDQPSGMWLAIRGRSGFLELLLVGDNASEFLGIRAGAPVRVRW